MSVGVTFAFTLTLADAWAVAYTAGSSGVKTTLSVCDTPGASTVPLAGEYVNVPGTGSPPPRRPIVAANGSSGDGARTDDGDPLDHVVFVSA